MPDRPHANRGAPFDTLYEASVADVPSRGGPLPSDLQRYGPRLAVALRSDRPTVIVNFVESLDGVVTFDPDHGSGAEVSGFNEPDRFVMGLLRALADVIVVGAGTVRSAPGHAWTPRNVHRAYADAYAAWRRELGLPAQPTTLVVTASGDLPTDHPALSTPDVPVVIVTTRGVAQRISSRHAPNVNVIGTDDDDRVSAASIIEVARAVGAKVVLSEGGPHLTGTFLGEDLLDELFLTLAPQLVGRQRGDGARYGLVEGLSLGIEDARWGRLRSVRRSVDHLFLRYGFGDVAADPQPGDRPADAASH